MKLFCVGQTVNRAAQRNLHQIPINFGIADWWGYTGKVKKASDIGNFFHFHLFESLNAQLFEILNSRIF